MREYGKLYVHGCWVAPRGRGHFEVINASTEEVMGRIPAGNAEDVDLAVRAARAAFPLWASLPRERRAELLEQLQAGLQLRSAELADVISGEVGMPIKLSQVIQTTMPTAALGNYASLLRTADLERRVGNSLIVKEPIGVVGCITPWNYPLNQVIAKIAPALAAGCTVVLKPSEIAPLSAFILVEVLDGVGFPPGVFNLVTGDGPTVGEAISAHPDVDMVSFTGSTRAGKRVLIAAAETVKRVALELGGKSASIILDDADLEKAVKGTVNNATLNSGQTCSAWTRLLVPEARAKEAGAFAKAAAEKLTLGNAQRGEGRLGPLVSAQQRERVREYIRQGLAEGATLLTGGPEQPEGLPKGFFVKPTVFADVTSDMTIAREEIFGPVLCILAYRDEADAIRIANDSIYGLAGGVWSASQEHALSVARQLRTGQVDINGGSFNLEAPFGGYKQSGLGREHGLEGLMEFFETKSLQL